MNKIMHIYTKLKKNIFGTPMSPPLKQVYDLFLHSPENQWILGNQEAVLLYELIKKYKPSHILELGTGIGASTAVMALASDASAKITTLEQFTKCINIAKSLIPDNLQKKINFVQSDPYAFKNDTISKYIYFSGYKNLPSSSFDFILVDGPAGWLEDGKFVSLTNGDIINLLPHMKIGGKILIDNRKQVVLMLKKYLGNYVAILEMTKRTTVFERTNKPLIDLKQLEIIDEGLEKMKRKGYFNQKNNC